MAVGSGPESGLQIIHELGAQGSLLTEDFRQPELGSDIHRTWMKLHEVACDFLPIPGCFSLLNNSMRSQPATPALFGFVESFQSVLIQAGSCLRYSSFRDLPSP